MASLKFNASGQLEPPLAEELVEADHDANILVLVTSVLEDGRPYYAYIAIRPSRYKEFMTVSEAKQEIILEDYGKIIVSGYELSAPPDVMAMMRTEYGFDTDYLEKLRKEVAAQRMDVIVAKLKKEQ